MLTDKLHSVIKTRGRAVAGLLLLVGVLGVRTWVVAPHLASLKAAQQSERAMGDRLEKSKTMNHQLRMARTRLKELTEEYALLSDMAFRPAKADEFLSDLEAFCEQSGCVVASLSFMSGRDQVGGDAGSSIVARGAALMIHGRYGSIARLIEKLQARREKVWIEELHMSRFADDVGPVACQMVITIYVNLDEESTGYEHGRIP